MRGICVKREEGLKDGNGVIDDDGVGETENDGLWHDE